MDPWGNAMIAQRVRYWLQVSAFVFATGLGMFRVEGFGFSGSLISEALPITFSQLS